MRQPDDPQQNQLLASLSQADLARLRPHMTWVKLRQGQVLHVPGHPQCHLHFSTGAVITKVCRLVTGGTAAVAVIGNEGLVGMSLLLGGDTWTGYDEVLIAGPSVRIASSAFRDVCSTSDSARQLLLRHVQALMTQIAQSVICYRFHSIEQRVCNLLLHLRDRVEDEELVLTQELMANLLGVRREGVTATIGHLQRIGLVRNWRGHIQVVDAAGLTRKSCECHAVVEREYKRLLPPPVGQVLVTRSGVQARAAV